MMLGSWPISRSSPVDTLDKTSALAPSGLSRVQAHRTRGKETRRAIAPILVGERVALPAREPDRYLDFAGPRLAPLANINTGRARPAFLQSLRSTASEGLLVLTARSPDAYVGGPCDSQEASFDPSPAFHREDSAFAVPSTPTSSSSSSSSSLPSSSGMIDSPESVRVAIADRADCQPPDAVDRRARNVNDKSSRVRARSRSGVSGGPRHARCSRGEIDDRSCAPVAPAARLAHFYSDERARPSFASSTNSIFSFGFFLFFFLVSIDWIFLAKD